MIFVTVGTQLPFDRLLMAVSDWSARNPGQEIIAQTGAGRADFGNIECHANLDQTEFRLVLEAADVVVAHAGTGTILMAAELGKPILIMPRRADLGEHRNDHQRDTAEQMAALGNVHVVQDAAELVLTLSDLVDHAGQYRANRLPATAQPQLIHALRDFIWAERRTASTPSRLREVMP